MLGSRVNNSKRNIFSGILKQLVTMILGFVVRTIILYVLGVEYQGLNGLFTSIISVLNLSDLGFSTAVIFILYKPIAEENIGLICAIVNFLKKIYFFVGIAILSFGLALMPFLKHLISGNIPSNINIYILYIIYLINASVSYMLFAYKSALLTAMQRQDVENNIYTFITIGVKILQIVVLITTKNYYMYAIAIPFGTIFNNILLQIYSKKVFPQIIPQGDVPKEIIDVFNKQIKAVFFAKIGDVARNSFDNIVISSLLGLAAVAIYDNYYYIYSAIYAVMGIIIHGISASVGNSIATTNVEKNYKDLQKINFIFMWIVGWCSICMLTLYQPFMLIWMKGNNEMMLSTFNMCLFCIYFYSINMTYVRSMYLDGNGLFYECKIWFIIEALANLISNFVLGYLLGISGIVLATIITIILFNFICRTNILFKCYFMLSPNEFYRQHILYALITIIAGLITYNVCGFVKVDKFLGLIIKFGICLIIPNCVYLAYYYKHRLFPEAMAIVRKIIPIKKLDS